MPTTPQEKYTAAQRAVAQHWGAWQARQQSGKYGDWADHPYVMGEILRRAFGSPKIDFYEFIKQKYPELRNAKALSLCCGDGSFEYELINKQVFGSIVGFDIAPDRVLAGTEKHGKALSPDVFRLECCDVNAANYGENEFDVVFAKSSLHHISQLEHAFSQIRRCLKPNGKLIALDFFGPSRFQWTDAQLKARSWFWTHRVPDVMKRDLDGSFIPEIEKPDIQALIKMDPSEAVRSGDLYRLISRNFDLVDDIAIGGAIVNLLLYGDLVNKFNAADESHNQIIHEAFDFERLLMSLGVVGSDFRFIVAHPKRGFWSRLF